MHAFFKNDIKKQFSYKNGIRFISIFVETSDTSSETYSIYLIILMQIVISIICKLFESNNWYITQDSKLFLLFLHISLFFIIPLYCHLPSIMQIAEGTRIGQVYSYCLLLFSVMSGVFKINESFYCCVAGIVFFFFPETSSLDCFWSKNYMNAIKHVSTYCRST